MAGRRSQPAWERRTLYEPGEGGKAHTVEEDCVTATGAGVYGLFEVRRIGTRTSRYCARLSGQGAGVGPFESECLDLMTGETFSVSSQQPEFEARKIGLAELPIVLQDAWPRAGGKPVPPGFREQGPVVDAEALRRVANRQRVDPLPVPAPAGEVKARLVATGSFNMVALRHLYPDPANPRRDLGDLSELADSVRANGIAQPLAVRPRGPGGYWIVGGHRRHAAAGLAGLPEVPCYIREMSDGEALEIMLVENLQRSELTPLEEAQAFQVLVRDHKLTQRGLAERVGRSQAHISKRLSLLQLPEDVRREIDSGGITLPQAQQLVQLAGDSKRIEDVLKHQGNRQYVIERHIDEARAERARLGRESELRAAGIKIFPRPVAGGSLGKEGLLRQPDVWWLPAKLRLDFSPEQHASESCHAVVVRAEIVRDAEVIRVAWICTNPQRHGPDGASSLKLPKKRNKQETAEERRLREADKAKLDARRRRREFLAEVLREVAEWPQPVDEFTELLLDVFLADANHDPAKLACQLLGLEVPAVANEYGGRQKDVRGTLQKHAQARPAHRLPCALALALALAELAAEGGWGSWTADKLGPLTRFLASQGYEFTQAERDSIFPQERGKAEVEVLGDAECRVCGCTEDEPCEGGCSWVKDPEGLGDLCSRCRAAIKGDLADASDDAELLANGKAVAAFAEGMAALHEAVTA